MSTIPVVASVDDIDAALQFAQRRPEARWYVAKRLVALGASARIPDDWDLPKQAGSVEKPVTAAIGGRLRGVSWDPSLHPRGRDGRFIETGGLVDIFLTNRSNRPSARGEVLGVREAKSAHGGSRGVRVGVRITEPGTGPEGEVKVGDEIEIGPGFLGTPNPTKARLDGDVRDPEAGRDVPVVGQKPVSDLKPGDAIETRGDVMVVEEVDPDESRHPGQVEVRGRIRDDGSTSSELLNNNEQVNIVDTSPGDAEVDEFVDEENERAGEARAILDESGAEIEDADDKLADVLADDADATPAEAADIVIKEDASEKLGENWPLQGYTREELDEYLGGRAEPRDVYDQELFENARAIEMENGDGVDADLNSLVEEFRSSGSDREKRHRVADEIRRYTVANNYADDEDLPTPPDDTQPSVETPSPEVPTASEAADEDWPLQGYTRGELDAALGGRADSRDVYDQEIFEEARAIELENADDVDQPLNELVEEFRAATDAQDRDRRHRTAEEIRRYAVANGYAEDDDLPEPPGNESLPDQDPVQVLMQDAEARGADTQALQETLQTAQAENPDAQAGEVAQEAEAALDEGGISDEARDRMRGIGVPKPGERAFPMRGPSGAPLSGARATKALQDMRTQFKGMQKVLEETAPDTKDPNWSKLLRTDIDSLSDMELAALAPDGGYETLAGARIYRPGTKLPIDEARRDKLVERLGIVSERGTKASKVEANRIKRELREMGLDETGGELDTDEATEGATSGAREVAANLREDNPLRGRLAAKAEGEGPLVVDMTSEARARLRGRVHTGTSARAYYLRNGKWPAGYEPTSSDLREVLRPPTVRNIKEALGAVGARLAAKPPRGRTDVNGRLVQSPSLPTGWVVESDPLDRQASMIRFQAGSGTTPREFEAERSKVIEHLINLGYEVRAGRNWIEIRLPEA